MKPIPDSAKKYSHFIEAKILVCFIRLCLFPPSSMVYLHAINIQNVVLNCRFYVNLFVFCFCTRRKSKMTKYINLICRKANANFLTPAFLLHNHNLNNFHNFHNFHKFFPCPVFSSYVAFCAFPRPQFVTIGGCFMGLFYPTLKFTSFFFAYFWEVIKLHI